MLYYFKKVKNAPETHTQKIWAVYGEGAMTDRMCQKWFVKFHATDFSLVDAPWLGRPVEVDSDQIETLIVNNQRYTLREIVNTLKISKSMKLLVKMKNMSNFMEETKWTFLAYTIYSEYRSYVTCMYYRI